MKKSFLPAFLLLFLALGMFSCQQGAKETTKEYPMFWTWLDYRPGMNFDSICQVMNDIGMDGIMLNAPLPTITGLPYRLPINTESKCMPGYGP